MKETMKSDSESLMMTRNYEYSVVPTHEYDQKRNHGRKIAVVLGLMMLATVAGLAINEKKSTKGSIQVKDDEAMMQSLVQIQGNTCKTSGSSGVGAGFQCVFPFKYKGRTYNECTYAGSKSRWCATQVDSNGNYISKKYGDCSPQCPHASKPFWIVGHACAGVNREDNYGYDRGLHLCMEEEFIQGIEVDIRWAKQTDSTKLGEGMCPDNPILADANYPAEGKVIADHGSKHEHHGGQWCYQYYNDFEKWLNIFVNLVHDHKDDSITTNDITLLWLDMKTSHWTSTNCAKLVGMIRAATSDRGSTLAQLGVNVVYNPMSGFSKIEGHSQEDFYIDWSQTWDLFKSPKHLYHGIPLIGGGLPKAYNEWMKDKFNSYFYTVENKHGVAFEAQAGMSGDMKATAKLVQADKGIDTYNWLAGWTYSDGADVTTDIPVWKSNPGYAMDALIVNLPSTHFTATNTLKQIIMDEPLLHLATSADSLFSSDLTGPSHTIGTPRMLSLKPAYNATELITIVFEDGPGNSKDWIAIYPAASTVSKKGYKAWCYLNGAKKTPSSGMIDGSVMFSNMFYAGSWKAYLLMNDGYSVAASVAFIVG